MDGWSILIFEFIANQIVLGFTLLFLLAGALFVMVSLFVLSVALVSKTGTYNTSATIIGALVHDRDGTERTGTRRSVQRYALVVEYTTPDGELRRGSMSEWSTSFLEYAEGGQLGVRVNPSQGHDNIYLADQSGNIKLGVVLLLAGIAITLFATRSILWWGILIAFSIGCVLFFKWLIQTDDPGRKRLLLNKTISDEDIVSIEALKK